MAQSDQSASNSAGRASYQKALANSYYTLLGLHPSASVRQIRQTYRELSKLYHPDTTTLPAAIAITKFQQLNEAYATLSSPEKRLIYDRSIGYSSIPVVQPLPDLHRSSTSTYRSSSAYIDATDRPLSPGEIFALFILGMTFLCCLVLAIAIGLTRGDSLEPPVTAQEQPIHQIIEPLAPSQSPVQVPTVAPSLPSPLVPSLPVLPSPASPGTQSPVLASPSASNSATLTSPLPTHELSRSFE